MFLDYMCQYSEKVWHSWDYCQLPRMWTQEEMQPRVDQTDSVVYRKNNQGTHLKSFKLNSKVVAFHFLIAPPITFWVIMGSGWKPRRPQLLTEKHRFRQFTKMNVSKLQRFPENTLRADETRQELFGYSYQQHHTYCEIWKQLSFVLLCDIGHSVPWICKWHNEVSKLSQHS